MVSRATHYRNKARHAQRELNQPRAALPDNDSWFSAALGAVRELFRQYPVENSWTARDFAHIMDITEAEADRRLRHFCKLGICRMFSLKDRTGRHVEFRFALADPGLHG